jgi:hypothetical protein
MRNRIGFFLLVGACLHLSFSTALALELRASLQPNDRFKLVLGKADLTWNCSDKQTELILKSDLQLNLQRENQNTILATALQNQSKEAAWVMLQKLNDPKVTIEISGPAIPVELVVREGNVKLKPCKQPFLIMHQTGRLEVLGGEGDLKINSLEGVVNIENRTGDILFDGYGAQVSIKDHSGSIVLRNIKGKSLLSKVKSDILYYSHSGLLNVVKSVGKANMFSQQGSIQGSEMEGAWTFDTESTSITLRPSVKFQTRIQAGQSNVFIAMPASSGARFNVTTEEGKLNLPAGVRPVVQDQMRVAQGRLGGSVPGSIVVKTKTGEIRIQ